MLFLQHRIRWPELQQSGTTSTSLRTCDYSLKVLCALRAIQLGSQQFNNRDAPPYLPQNDNFLSILRRNMVYLLSTLRDGVLQVCDSVDNVAVSKVHYSKVADQLESLSKVTHVSLKLFANTIAKLQELTAAQRASTLSMTTEVILSVRYRPRNNSACSLTTRSLRSRLWQNRWHGYFPASLDVFTLP